MLSSASLKTQLERELGQVCKAVLSRVTRATDLVCHTCYICSMCAYKSIICTQRACETDQCTVRFDL